MLVFVDEDKWSNVYLLVSQMRSCVWGYIHCRNAPTLAGIEKIGHDIYYCLG